MKLEVGMYVRTPYGIRKIVNITKDDGYGKPRVKVIELDDFLNTDYKFNYKFYTDEKIIKECKASYNIIDILEVGDYVNGSEILDFKYKFIEENDNFTNFAVVTENCYLEDTDSWIIEKNIKSVITHEQIEQMEYRIGE
jgi:hypothetical protein